MAGSDHGYGASDIDDVVFDHEPTPDEQAFIDAHGDGWGDCGCGGDGSCGGRRHTAEEAAAAEEFRARHREDAGTGKRENGHMIVVSFSSTFDAMEAERLCKEAGVPGRIIPLPVQIAAECGLAWSMPCSGDALAAFRAAIDGAVEPEDFHQLML